jgi:putative ABC transport system substrate-binding protein
MVTLPFPRLESQIATLAIQAHFPIAGGSRELAEAGGLFGYGPSLTEEWRRAAVFVDKVLRGAKPADMPVEQPMTFDLVINRNTAQAFDITVPPDIAAQVTEWVP